MGLIEQNLSEVKIGENYPCQLSIWKKVQELQERKYGDTENIL